MSKQVFFNRRILVLVSTTLLFLILGVSCDRQLTLPEMPDSLVGAQSGARETGVGGQQDEEEIAVKPFVKPDGSPWTIGVVQSGDYYYYNDVLAAILSGLGELGWLQVQVWDAESKATIPLMLAKAAQGASFIRLDPGFYVDLEFDESDVIPQSMYTLLSGSGGADLVISLGTLAGTYVKRIADEGKLAVPVLVESVSDPIGSGIITSETDSGHPLINASVDPGEYRRQIELFHQVIGFKRLGILYTDTELGRAYAALKDVQDLSKARNFEVVAYTDLVEDPDPEDLSETNRAAQKYQEGLRYLSDKVDAVYLAIQGGLTLDSLPGVVDLANEANLPIFAMEGAEFVRRGALMGESDVVLDIEGLYRARKISLIFNGSKAGELSQLGNHVPHIAINLDTAKNIGLKLPVEIILSADDVFTTRFRDAAPEVQ